MNNTEESIFRQETIPETVQIPGCLNWICCHRGAILKAMAVTCHNQLLRTRTDRTRLLISHCNSFYWDTVIYYVQWMPALGIIVVAKYMCQQSVNMVKLLLYSFAQYHPTNSQT